MSDYGLFHLQSQSDVEDVALLKGDDLITYSVLARILKGECADTYTNRKSVIVCHSRHPYPVWVWCKEVSVDEDVRQIASCLKETFSFEKGFAVNLGYELLERLKEVDPYFVHAKIKMNLLSYRLDQLNETDHPCDGAPEQATLDNLECLTKLWRDGCLEMEGMEHDEEFCLNHTRARIEQRNLFFWRNGDGEIVAITGRGNVDQYSNVTSVYTRPDKRRRGYAMNLVAHVTKTILDDGLTPILYTNADYAASNECYQKIGYKQVGSLCTIK